MFLQNVCGGKIIFLGGKLLLIWDLQAFWKVHRTFSLFEKFTEKCLLSDSSLYLDDLYQPGFSCGNIFHLQSISDFLTTPQNLSLGRQFNFNAMVIHFFYISCKNKHWRWKSTLECSHYPFNFSSIAVKNNFPAKSIWAAPSQNGPQEIDTTVYLSSLSDQ